MSFFNKVIGAGYFNSSGAIKESTILYLNGNNIFISIFGAIEDDHVKTVPYRINFNSSGAIREATEEILAGMR